jgi:hypothetical protein
MKQQGGDRVAQKHRELNFSLLLQKDDEFMWKKSKCRKNIVKQGYVYGSTTTKDPVAVTNRQRATCKNTRLQGFIEY